MINKPEEASELLEVVASNLVCVEERLVAVESHKNAVRENFEIVKEQISEVVERQLSNLKSKERQLLRQVELATTHQNCELVVKLAQLSSHKGALSKSRSILDNCSDQWAELDSNTKSSLASSMDSSSDQDLASLLDNTDKLIAAPIVSVALNETDLENCIKNLGSVSLPCSLPSHDLLPHSWCEEYGDMDHHVLYKSLQPDTPRAIDVRKPYLLAVKNKKTSAKSTKSEDSKKEELYKWLHHLQLDNYTDSYGDMKQECCQNAVPCIEEACQANETCSSFANCLMGGQCQKNAQEKIDQSRNWIQKQMKSGELDEKSRSNSENSPISSVLKHMDTIMNGGNDEFFNYKVSRSQNNLNLTPMKFAVSEKRSSSDVENSPINSVLNHMDAIMNGEDFNIETACKRMKRSDSNLNLTPVNTAVPEKRSIFGAEKSPINSVLNHMDAIMNGGNDKVFNCKDSCNSICNMKEKSHSNLSQMKTDESETNSNMSAKNSPINSILSHMDTIMNGDSFKSFNRVDSSDAIYKSHTNINSTVPENPPRSDSVNSPINSMLKHLDFIMDGANYKSFNSNDSSDAISYKPEKNSISDARLNKTMTDYSSSSSDAKNSPINSVLSHLDAIMNGENHKLMNRKDSMDTESRKVDKNDIYMNQTVNDILKSQINDKTIMYEPTDQTNWAIKMEKGKIADSVLFKKYSNEMISSKEKMINSFSNKSPLERTKSQMTMTFSDDLENVKERMEKISFDNHEDKKWLLDMDNKMTENKITEEITKSKDDCNSSVSGFSATSSFEVLSNPESVSSYSSWVLH